MLKITYTQSGLSLQQSREYLETWVINHTRFCLKSGMPLYLNSVTATFLLPMNLPSLSNFIDNLDGELNNTLEIVINTNGTMELKLSGTWVSSNSNSEEGLFLVAYNNDAEICLFNLLKEYDDYSKRIESSDSLTYL